MNLPVGSKSSLWPDGGMARGLLCCHVPHTVIVHCPLRRVTVADQQEMEGAGVWDNFPCLILFSREWPTMRTAASTRTGKTMHCPPLLHAQRVFWSFGLK
ncbi:hypothetical protein BJX64DRAFT_222113 [Aspergillus heterothallicus]